VKWTKERTSFDLEVFIPAGMEADIALPTLGLADIQVKEGGMTVWNSNAYVPGTPGITRAETASASIVFLAGSGSYHFTLKGAAE